jgi:hypothetical protein
MGRYGNSPPARFRRRWSRALGRPAASPCPTAPPRPEENGFVFGNFIPRPSSSLRATDRKKTDALRPPPIPRRAIPPQAIRAPVEPRFRSPNQGSFCKFYRLHPGVGVPRRPEGHAREVPVPNEPIRPLPPAPTSDQKLAPQEPPCPAPGRDRTVAPPAFPSAPTPGPARGAGLIPAGPRPRPHGELRAGAPVSDTVNSEGLFPPQSKSTCFRGRQRQGSPP